MRCEPVVSLWARLQSSKRMNYYVDLSPEQKINDFSRFWGLGETHCCRSSHGAGRVGRGRTLAPLGNASLARIPALLRLLLPCGRRILRHFVQIWQPYFLINKILCIFAFAKLAQRPDFPETSISGNWLQGWVGRHTEDVTDVYLLHQTSQLWFYRKEDSATGASTCDDYWVTSLLA